jgi:hypothetical protein
MLQFAGRGLPLGFASSRPLERGEPLPDANDVVRFLNQSFNVVNRDFEYSGTTLVRIVILLERPEPE